MVTVRSIAIISGRVIAIYLGFLFVMAVHELGHWISGSLCDFQCKEFRVGSFCWLSSTGWKVEGRMQWLITGRVFMYPASPLRGLRHRYLLCVLGGPGANFVTAFIAALIGRSEWRISIFAMVYFMASLFFGFVNLIPVGSGRFKSDGMQIVELLFSRRRATRIRFVGTYLEAVPHIREHLVIQDWLSAKRVAEGLLAESPGGTEVEEMEKALRVAVNLSERGISAINSLASREDQDGDPSA